MQHDIHNNFEVRRMISPVRQTNSDTAVVSQIIDCANRNSIEIVIATGNLTDANATFAATLEESNDSGMSGANAVAAGDIVGAASVAAGLSFTATADDNAIKRIGYIGSKRYLRLTITPTGNDSGNLDVGAVAILGNGRKQPLS